MEKTHNRNKRKQIKLIIEPIEMKLFVEINKAKNDLLNLGVDLESFFFEFEPRYRKLLEHLRDSGKICLDINKVGFALFLPSLTDKRKDFVVYFSVDLKKCIVTTATKSENSKEIFPYLLVSIPISPSVSEKDIYSHIDSYLLPNDFFSIIKEDIIFKFSPLVKYRELVI
jgi:hypothetical protein